MSEAWTEVNLGRIARRRAENVTLAPGESYRLMGIRWKNLGPYERGVGTTETVKAKSMFRMRQGDFVFNRIDTDKGAFGVVDAHMSGAVASNEFPAYVCEHSQLLSGYLWLHFQQETVLGGLRSAGSEGRARWKEADFERHTILLPSLANQHRIVDLIGALDEAIAAADDAGISSRVAYAELGLSLSERSWDVRPLSELVQISKAGGTPSRSNETFYVGDIPWLKSGEVNDPNITKTGERISEEALKQSSAWLAPVGAIVVAMYGATAGQIGRLGTPMAMNQAVLALVADETVVTPRFLYHLLRSQSSALKSKAVGAAQPNLSKQVVMAHELPLPSLIEQSQLCGLFDAAEDAANAAEDLASSLRILRTNLLTALLSGEHKIQSSYDKHLGAIA